MRDAVYDAVFDSLEHASQPRLDLCAERLRDGRRARDAARARRRRLVERSARLGELLLEQTRPLVERYEVVKDVRGLGLMWAIEFGEPDDGPGAPGACSSGCSRGSSRSSSSSRCSRDHRILSQVAGHRMNVVKGAAAARRLRGDIDWFVDALDQVVGEAQNMGRSMTSFGCGRARGAARKPAPSARLTLARLPAETAEPRRAPGAPPGGDDRDRSRFDQICWSRNTIPAPSRMKCVSGSTSADPPQDTAGTIRAEKNAPAMNAIGR